MSDSPVNEGPLRVTKSRYADMRRVSKAAVSKWLKEGKIAETAEGLIDVAAADASLAARTNQLRGGKGGKRSVAASLPAASAAKVPAGGEQQDPPGPKVPTLADANAEKVRLQAAILAQEFRVRTGELVERAAFVKALGDALGPMMQQLDGLSARIGSRVAGEHDVRRVQTLIDDEVALVRAEIARRVRALTVDEQPVELAA